MPTEYKLKLSKCTKCGWMQYPPRQLCSNCLSDDLTEQDTKPVGKVIAATLLHYSFEESLQSTLPNYIGLIKLDVGPILFSNLEKTIAKNDRVTLTVKAGLDNKDTFWAKHLE